MLRPAAEVARDVIETYEYTLNDDPTPVIQADRRAVIAECAQVCREILGLASASPRHDWTARASGQSRNRKASASPRSSAISKRLQVSRGGTPASEKTTGKDGKYGGGAGGGCCPGAACGNCLTRSGEGG